MATVNQVIEKLRRRQIEFARSDLSVPTGKKGFDYGVACGTFKAYEQMLLDIESLLEEEKEAEKRRENDT
jgi:hypothetical protein